MIAIEHHFAPNETLRTEINLAIDSACAMALIEAAMHKEGWSDSRMVNVDSLPAAAQEHWFQLAATTG